jgi:hypothetical protein
VYYYEPVIHGFKLAGKRGSKYFAPNKQGVLITKEQSMALEKSL